MALLKLSGLVSRISGKVGGSVFTFGQGGQVLKQNAFSIGSQTVAQTIPRNNIQLIVSQWNELTPTQKATYQSEVGNYQYTNKVGDIVNYNAYQIFLLVNYNRFQIGEPVLTTCPAYAATNFSVWTASYILPTGYAVEKNNLQSGNTLQVFTAVSKSLVTNTASLNFVKIAQILVTSGNQVIILNAELVATFGYLNFEWYIYTKIKEVDTATGIPTSLIALQTVYLP